MDQLSLAKQAQPIQQLLSEHPDKGGAQSTELILLDQLVQIDAEQLKHQTQVLAMDEGIFEAEDVMIVVLVHATIEQIQDRNFHHTLIEVGGLVLHHLDRNDFLCPEILAFDHLTESTLTKNIEDQVAILVIRLFRPENVVDVKDVITVLIVEPIVFNAFAWLGENSSRVAGGFVLEARVADAVGGGKMGGECLQWTDESTFRVGSSKGWLGVDARGEEVDVGDFGELRWAGFGTGIGLMLLLLLLLHARRLRLVSEHGIELLCGRLRVMGACGRQSGRLLQRRQLRRMR